MKRKSLFLIGTIFSSLALVGGTLATAITWAVTDDAPEKSADITPKGEGPEAATKSVILEWGTVELVDIQELGNGEKKGPYHVQVKATTSTTESYEGAFSVSLSSNVVSGTKLIDSLEVKVFEENVDTGTPVLTLAGSPAVEEGGKSVAKASQDITATHATVKDLYLFVYLKSVDATTYQTISSQQATLTIDWGKGSTTSAVSSKTLYFNNTESWTNVYVYAWKKADGSKNNTWPGLKMTQAKGSIYAVSLDVTDGYDRVIFNNGNGTQLDAIDLDEKAYYNGGEWQDKPNLDAETVYYLVGTHNNWQTGTTALFTSGEFTKGGKSYTYKIENVSVAAGGKVKVVSSLNVWYGEFASPGTDMTIGEPNAYDFYFNPSPAVGDPYIFCEAHS